jgi:hypothetical protein
MSKEWKGTSLNVFTRQRYRCSKCGHIDWWNYSHMQIRGKMVRKPWSKLPWFRPNRPVRCENCKKELNFAYGSGPDSWRDSYLPYWRGLFIILIIIFGGGIYLAHYHNIQIFEELAKLLFPGMQIN